VAGVPAVELGVGVGVGAGVGAGVTMMPPSPGEATLDAPSHAASVAPAQLVSRIRLRRLKSAMKISVPAIPG
jgi:hypothetical protein